MKYREITGIVFNIQRFTIHDGPGIRTEIFLKGCPLRCKWCSNPESFKAIPEIAVHPSKCIGVDVCGACLSACHLADPKIFSVEEGTVTGVDRCACDNCLACADQCPADALTIYGKRMIVGQVLQTVLADRAYYKDEGGVTFSGGEAFYQPEFLKACLMACKTAGIHTCVESALDIPARHLEQTLSLIDLIIFDLKVMADDRHRAFTGRSNERILANAQLLGKAKHSMIVRIPVIPGYNDDDPNIAATASFIKEQLGNSVLQVQLLPYRPLGIEKYDSLGIPYPMHNTVLPERDAAEHRIKEIASRMRQMGVPAVAGTTTLLPAGYRVHSYR